MSHPLIRVPRSSRAYVYVPDVQVSIDGDVDPTTLPVQVAFLPLQTPVAEDDWVAGEWKPAAATPTVRVLVGPPDGLQPGVGSFSLWLRIDGAAEDPTEPVATVRFT